MAMLPIALASGLHLSLRGMAYGVSFVNNFNSLKDTTVLGRVRMIDDIALLQPVAECNGNGIWSNRHRSLHHIQFCDQFSDKRNGK